MTNNNDNPTFDIYEIDDSELQDNFNLTALEKFVDEHPEFSEYADALGYLMLNIIGTMHNLGLTNLSYFVTTYLRPDTDDKYLNESIQWLRSIVSSAKQREERNEVMPQDLIHLASAYKAYFMASKFSSNNS